MDKDDREHEYTPEGEATVLPAREAMSLITPDPSVGFIPEMGEVPSPGPVNAGAADATHGAVDAQGSASGEENVTSEDRDDHFENSDSASSHT